VRGRHDADEDDGSQEEGVAGGRGAAQDPAHSPIQLPAGGRQADGTAATDRGREGRHPAVPEQPLARIAHPCSAGPLASLESVCGIEIPLLPAGGWTLAGRRIPRGRQAGQERWRGSPSAHVPDIHPEGRHGRTVALPRSRGSWHGQNVRLPAGCRPRSGAEEGLSIRLESGHRPIRPAPGQRQARPADAGGGVAAVRLHHAQAHVHQPQARLADVRLHHAQGGFHQPQARHADVRVRHAQGGFPRTGVRCPEVRLAVLPLHHRQARFRNDHLHRAEARLPALPHPQAWLAALRAHHPQARVTALCRDGSESGFPGACLRHPGARLAALRVQQPRARLRLGQARPRPSQAVSAALGPPRSPGAGSLAPPRRRTSPGPAGDFCAAHV
jgi:hypothetical protein